MKKRRKEKEQGSTTGVAIFFSVPRSSDHRLCAEAAAPLSSSISVTRVRRESKNREKRPKKRRETQAKQGERKGAFL
jgi:hypothetical protein